MYLFAAAGFFVSLVGVVYGLAWEGGGLAVVLWAFAYLLKKNLEANRRKLESIPYEREAESRHTRAFIESLSSEFESTTVEDASGVPSFSTFVGGRSVQFRAAGKSLIISSTLPMGDFRLFIYPEQQLVASFRNVVDVSIGDREFDRRFAIQTNDSGQAARFLGARIKVAIHELADLVVPRPFGVTFNKGQVRLFLPLDNSSKSMIVSRSVALLETIQRELGIWSDESVMEILPEKVIEEVPNCLVCGDAVSDQRVECRQCRTAHHKECWDYIGKCSVFGCGSTRSR